MKRLTLILGSLFLVAAVAVPVSAHGPGRGKGRGYGGGPGACWGNDGRTGNLTQEQRTQLNALHQKFYDETATIRNDLWTKSGEMRNLLNTSNPDVGRVKALQKEISELKAQLAQKRIDLALEARKIAPEGAFVGPYGYGMGFGHHGYGRHRGDGPGGCWN